MDRHWVGQDGLLSRVAFEARPPDGQDGHLKFTADFLEHDVEIDVAEPPPAVDGAGR